MNQDLRAAAEAVVLKRFPRKSADDTNILTTEGALVDILVDFAEKCAAPPADQGAELPFKLPLHYNSVQGQIRDRLGKYVCACGDEIKGKALVALANHSAPQDAEIAKLRAERDELTTAIACAFSCDCKDRAAMLNALKGWQRDWNALRAELAAAREENVELFNTRADAIIKWAQSEERFKARIAQLEQELASIQAGRELAGMIDNLRPTWIEPAAYRELDESYFKLRKGLWEPIKAKARELLAGKGEGE